MSIDWAGLARIGVAFAAGVVIAFAYCEEGVADACDIEVSIPTATLEAVNGMTDEVFDLGFGGPLQLQMTSEVSLQISDELGGVTVDCAPVRQ